ncbi:hypothetical protein ACQ4LE_009739 [Meloidogyne hapla]
MAGKRTRHDAGFPSPASSDLIDNQIMEQLKLAATIDLSAILADENISPGIKAILQQQHAANCALFKFLTMQQQTEDPAEKKERERSVVIIGIKESPSDVPSERHKNDVAMVTGLFDQLGIEPTPVVYRLGRQSDPARKGPRLIKAILPAKFFQFMVLGAWKRCRTDIRKQHGYENMLIRPSLTLEQRMKEREERKFRDKTPDKKKLFPRTSSLLSEPFMTGTFYRQMLLKIKIQQNLNFGSLNFSRMTYNYLNYLFFKFFICSDSNDNLFFFNFSCGN